jgi:hypothetical protein
LPAQPSDEHLPVTEETSFISLGATVAARTLQCAARTYLT